MQPALKSSARALVMAFLLATLITALSAAGRRQSSNRAKENDQESPPVSRRDSRKDSQDAKPLAGLTIVVDAGHGGKDPGAISNGVSEKELTLCISSKLADSLKGLGCKVVLTRLDDRFIALDERVAIAKRAKATLFVSVHINSSTNEAARGVETCYCLDDSRLLAELIVQQLGSNLNERNRGAQRRSLRVTKNVMPSVLAEVGFISNTKTRAQLVDSVYQKSIADAIANGVVAYCQRTSKSSSAQGRQF